MAETLVGAAGPKFAIGPVNRTDFVRYAGASNDFNPLHHDDDYARSAGYPSVFAHGMFSAGVLASYLVRWFGPESVRRFQVAFREQVWPGDTLAARGRVIRIYDHEDERRAVVELTLVRQTGDVCVSGEAEVDIGLPPDDR
jgi:acyl dehydratase